MDDKELIKNVTYNESGCERPLEESVISFLQILVPKPTTSEAKDDEPLSYKNCNSFELLYDNRRPQIIYYLGDYMYDAEANPSRFLSCLPNINFEGTTVGDGGDLTEMYKACEAIKKWAENTMYLIGEKCIDENHTADWTKVDADILKDMEKLGWNINNKTQDNEIQNFRSKQK